MPRASAFLVLWALCLLGCFRGTSSADHPVPSAWPTDWSRLLGARVTVEGTSVNAKLGAMLVGARDDRVWIAKLDAWPAGFYRGGDDGTRVRVTGTVVQADDLPVFVPQEGEPAMQGMPVAPGTDLEKARRRYLLADATWVVID